MIRIAGLNRVAMSIEIGPYIFSPEAKIRTEPYLRKKSFGKFSSKYPEINVRITKAFLKIQGVMAFFIPIGYVIANGQGYISG